MTSDEFRDLLIKEFLPVSKAVAYNICRAKSLHFNKWMVEDCQSAGIEGMIKAIDSYNPTSGASLKTWVIKNIYFSVLSYIKAERKWLLVDLDEESIQGIVTADGEDRMCDRDLVFKIFYFVERIRGIGKKDSMAEMLISYYFDGKLQKDIADHYECTPANVSTAFSRLKAAVLKEFGG